MIPKDKLVWGKPCRRHNHQKEDGTNLRHITKVCMMCDKGDKLGITNQDELYTYLINKKPPKRTPEEKAAGAVAASMRWNARNKDKTKIYTAKYAKTEERKAVIRKKNREKWQSLTDEERKERSKTQYQKFLESHARTDLTAEELAIKKEESRRRQEENYQRSLAKQREKYAAMTQEEKEELYEKRRERKLAKMKDE
jgi:hypothetical protein